MTTKISQELAQVEQSATTLGWTKISQLLAQVEVEPAKFISENIEISADIDAVSNLPRILLGDSFSAFNYTNYQNTIDNPHISPIRIAKIELPGKTLYLCDRIWGGT